MPTLAVAGPRQDDPDPLTQLGNWALRHTRLFYESTVVLPGDVMGDILLVAEEIGNQRCCSDPPLTVRLVLAGKPVEVEGRGDDLALFGPQRPEGDPSFPQRIEVMVWSHSGLGGCRYE
jgi:hypothetical protein